MYLIFFLFELLVLSVFRFLVCVRFNFVEGVGWILSKGSLVVRNDYIFYCCYFNILFFRL